MANVAGLPASAVRALQPAEDAAVVAPEKGGRGHRLDPSVHSLRYIT